MIRDLVSVVLLQANALTLYIHHGDSVALSSPYRILFLLHLYNVAEKIKLFRDPYVAKWEGLSLRAYSGTYEQAGPIQIVKINY